MLDFQQKRKVRSLMYNHVTLYVLGAVVLIVLHSTWSVYKKKNESEELKNISEQHVEELRQRDSELRAQLARLDTVPGVEEEIRSKFSVAKDKENIVVIVNDEEKSVSTTSSEKGLWNKIKKLFSK